MFVDITLLNGICRPSESINHLTFTNKPDNPPYEVAAVMTEGRFGQGDFPIAVSGRVNRVPRLRTGRLLRLFPPGSGARARAVVLHPTAVCHLSVTSNVHPVQNAEIKGSTRLVVVEVTYVI